MAERTPSHLTVETITRILNEKTSDPRISTVLELGESVGLTPWELFAETNDLIAYQGFVTLQAEHDKLQAEFANLQDENVTFKDKVVNLEAENDRLHLTLAHKEEIVSLQKELIDLHRIYNPEKNVCKF